ncbi:MAG: hypothetical protein IJ092_06045 [Atopobiaceae bacterium]|nr:hypothetical protein [Atopobiaceae bacterium]
MDKPTETNESLFIRLCSQDMRDAFIEHRSRKLMGEELGELAAYIKSDECVDDLRRLARGDFDFPLPRQVKLRKNHSTRRRIIYIYPPRQNMLLKYLVWGMREYDSIFSDSLYSFRQNLNVANLFRKMEIQGDVHELYAVKADVHDYGHSIRPELLKPMLADIVGSRDPKLFAFLEYLLMRHEFLRDNEVVHASMGGLPGVPVGCFFNNVYLMGLDAAMDERASLYSRYADDICVFVSSAEAAQEALEQIRYQVTSMGLSLNEDKTQIIEPGGSIELLGIQIRGSELDVADNTLSKAKSKLTHYAKKLMRWERYGKISKEEAAERMALRINRYFYGDGTTEHQLSWREFFFRVITRPDTLHELDLVCQDLLRKVATGKLGNARYRCRYEDLRSLGYTPLVHEYYSYRKEPASR